MKAAATRGFASLSAAFLGASPQEALDRRTPLARPSSAKKASHSCGTDRRHGRDWSLQGLPGGYPGYPAGNPWALDDANQASGYPAARRRSVRAPRHQVLPAAPPRRVGVVSRRIVAIGTHAWDLNQTRSAALHDARQAVDGRISPLSLVFSTQRPPQSIGTNIGRFKVIHRLQKDRPAVLRAHVENFLGIRVLLVQRLCVSGWEQSRSEPDGSTRTSCEKAIKFAVTRWFLLRRLRHETLVEP